MKAVDAGFDRHDIPCDVIWMDIEHTEGKRYFTWDAALFPPTGQPAAPPGGEEEEGEFLAYIVGLVCFWVSRIIMVHFFLLCQLVVITDPHIKIDPGWCLSNEARDGGHFIKNRDGQIYEGSRWPGNVSLTE